MNLRIQQKEHYSYKPQSNRMKFINKAQPHWVALSALARLGGPAETCHDLMAEALRELVRFSSFHLYPLIVKNRDTLNPNPSYVCYKVVSDML